ncbi:MAG: hypothetical protein WAN14_18210, partial [Candidatus Acidiferrales bacterium]
DDEIEKLIRANVLDIETGLAFATNEGNLRLLIADIMEPPQDSPSPGLSPSDATQTLETEEAIER